MPSPTVAASDRVRISRAGCASGGGRSGASKGYSGHHSVAGPARLAQSRGGNGVLPSAQRRSSTPAEIRSQRKRPMATHKLLLLPGDGIGPEVMGEVKRLIDWLNSAGIAKFETDTGLVGGS